MENKELVPFVAFLCVLCMVQLSASGDGRGFLSSVAHCHEIKAWPMRIGNYRLRLPLGVVRSPAACRPRREARPTTGPESFRAQQFWAIRPRAAHAPSRKTHS